MFGDDCGYIHILYFKNPLNALFDPLRRKIDPTKVDKATSHTVQRIFWDVSGIESNCIRRILSFVRFARN